MRYLWIFVRLQNLKTLLKTQFVMEGHRGAKTSRSVRSAQPRASELKTDYPTRLKTFFLRASFILLSLFPFYLAEPLERLTSSTACQVDSFISPESAARRQTLYGTGKASWLSGGSRCGGEKEAQGIWSASATLSQGGMFPKARIGMVTSPVERPSPCIPQTPVNPPSRRSLCRTALIRKHDFGASAEGPSYKGLPSPGQTIVLPLAAPSKPFPLQKRFLSLRCLHANAWNGP